MTQLSLFPPPPPPVPVAISQWECPNLQAACKKAKALFDDGGWKNITILNPDLTKPDRIVQAVRA